MNDDQTAPLQSAAAPRSGPSAAPTGPPAAGPAPEPAPEPTAGPAAAPPPPRWRERAAGLRGRTLGLRAVAAVALAALVVGGAGGALVHAAVAEEPGGLPGSSIVQDGDAGRGDRGSRGGPPPGWAPEGTPPQEDVLPDSGTDQSSGSAT